MEPEPPIEGDEEDPYDLTPLSLEQLAARLEGRGKVQDRVEVVWELAARAKADDAAYAALLAAARTASSPEIRAASVEEIANTGRLTSQAINTITDLLLTEKSGKVKLAAVELFAVHFTNAGTEAERALPALLHVWSTSRGDIRDHADTAVRLISGRFADQWTPKERQRLLRGQNPARVAKAGCGLILVLVTGGLLAAL